jgi:hypothetical protein
MHVLQFVENKRLLSLEGNVLSVSDMNTKPNEISGGAVAAKQRDEAFNLEIDRSAPTTQRGKSPIERNRDVAQRTDSAGKGGKCPTIGMKIHLKRTTGVHLALCGMWPGKNWVLMQDLPKQAAHMVCRVCTTAATRWSLEVSERR